MTPNHSRALSQSQQNIKIVVMKDSALTDERVEIRKFENRKIDELEKKTNEIDSQEKDTGKNYQQWKQGLGRGVGIADLTDFKGTGDDL